VLAALTGAGFGVAAHTTIEEQALEGQEFLNAVQIEHGCENDRTGKSLPVIAQSVLFPTQNPTVMRSDGTLTTLAAEITDTVSVAGLARLVQDRNIFKVQQEIYDANGNVIGFRGTQGRLQTDLLGRIPFQWGPLLFQPNSCAKRLRIQVAIADICRKTFPPKAGTANLWIPQTTSKFTDTSNEGIGSPATLTINRNLANNPLAASCGAGYDVTVIPSNEDIDAHLPFKGWGK
jgi:hypothetical protein